MVLGISSQNYFLSEVFFLCLAWLLHRLSFLSNRRIFPSTWELYCSSVEFFFLPVLRKVSIDNSSGEICLSVPLLRWLCNNKIEHFRRCRNLELGNSFFYQGFTNTLFTNTEASVKLYSCQSLICCILKIPRHW